MAELVNSELVGMVGVSHVSINVIGSVGAMSPRETAALSVRTEYMSDTEYGKAMNVMVGPTRIAVCVAPNKGQWRTLFGYCDDLDEPEKLLYRISPKGANVWVDRKYDKLVLHDASKESGIETIHIKKIEKQNLFQTTRKGLMLTSKVEAS